MASPPMFEQEERLAGGVVALPLPAEGQFDLRYVMVAHHRTQRSLPHLYLLKKILTFINNYRRQSGVPSLLELGKNAELEIVQEVVNAGSS
jgi:hypothetical protein